MKKIIFTFLSVFCVLALNAQITITSTDIAVPLNTKNIMQIDTIPTGINIGTAGVNLTWNFSGINNHQTDTVTILAPSSCPNSASFPTANLALHSTLDNGFAFLNNTATSLMLVGQAGTRDINGSSFTLVVPLNPTQQFMKFGCTYQTNYINTSKYDVKMPYGQTVTLPGVPIPILVDSIHAKNITVVKDTIDAWGTVTTPLGTFPCLREKRMEFKIDSVWAFSTFTSWTGITQFLPKLGVDTIITYSWLTSGISVPVIKVTVDNKYGIPVKVNYLKTTPYIGINEITANNIKLNVYPNPANSEINITSNLNENANFELFDLAGKIVKSELIIGQNQKINLDGISNGMYIYSLKDVKGNYLSNGKLSVTK
ncbi:MAG: T9SS type A sorting domain-containing protein [Bacteroidetes bacterium]|nr:T9SS type A sorting domain-containing protein [Bacteroidota bacterium]